MKAVLTSAGMFEVGHYGMFPTILHQPRQILQERISSARADVGIGPYVPAQPHPFLISHS